MKKLIALLLVISSLLPLCACGTAVPEPIVTEKIIEKEVPVVPEEYVRYRDLLDALEAGNYDSAQSILDSMKPESAISHVKDVKITRENFFDYFEFVAFPDYGRSYSYDRDGTVLAVGGMSGFYLKDGYTVAKDSLSLCYTGVAVKYDILSFAQNENITVDLENCTYTVTGAPSQTDAFYKMLDGSIMSVEKDGSYSYSYYISLPGFNLQTSNLSNIPDMDSWVVDNIDLEIASGVLYLNE